MIFFAIQLLGVPYCDCFDCPSHCPTNEPDWADRLCRAGQLNLSELGKLDWVRVAGRIRPLSQGGRDSLPGSAASLAAGGRNELKERASTIRTYVRGYGFRSPGRDPGSPAEEAQA
jgi:hypothetical protein